jgi:hypothetical protein
MHVPAAWVSACVLSAIIAGCAEVSSPSPEVSPSSVGRVSVPEQGYAVRVPTGAVGIDLSADVERQVRSSIADDPAAFDWLIGDDPAALVLLVEGLEQWRETGWQVVVMGDEAMCQYSVRPETPPNFDAFALGLYTDLLNDESYTQVAPPAFVELDAGPAVLLTARATSGPPWRGGYAGVRDDATFWVICRGPVERDDRWRPFADAFEWPDEPWRRRIPGTIASLGTPTW